MRETSADNSWNIFKKKKTSLKVLWRLMTKLERMGGDTEIDELDEQDEQYH